MSVTLISDVSNQVKTFWSDLMMDELKERSLLASLVNKDYEGDLEKAGDRVRVSQINRPTAQRKTVGSGHETFSSSLLSTSYVDIVADQVISAAYKFDDLVELQSQIGDQNSKIRQGLEESLDIALNDYLYSLIAPSASAPDHITTGVTDFNAAALANERTKASAAKWAMDGNWIGLLSPQYYSDLLNAATLVSTDNVDEKPLLAGRFGTRRFGFNLFEDNSAGNATIHASDAGLFFHPDFLHLVMPKAVEIEVSSLHSQEQFGFVMSARMVVGAKLGINGDVKHTTVEGS
jgi:hypothetical protein